MRTAFEMLFNPLGKLNCLMNVTAFTRDHCVVCLEFFVHTAGRVCFLLFACNLRFVCLMNSATFIRHQFVACMEFYVEENNM